MLEEIKERLINIFTSRLTIFYIGMVFLACILIHRCFTLQIVNGQTYLDNFVLEQEKTRNLDATRGNIYDRDGNLLAYSQLAYSVKIEDTFESGSSKNKALNAMIESLIRMIEKNGDSINMDLKIYIDEDGEYAYSVSDAALKRFLADVYDHIYTDDLTDEEAASTPMEIMEYLSRYSGNGYHYAVGQFENPTDTKSKWLPGEGYDREMWLKIINVRYAMSQTAFRKYIGTVVASDISDETMAVLMENAEQLPGVSIVEDTIRKYEDSVYFSHVLGYTGKISSDEITALNEAAVAEGKPEDTYTSNDVVGKLGIESFMESTLQGTKGYERVMVNTTGKVISVLERREPTAGNDVYLTLDRNLTIAVYEILEQKLAGLISSKVIDAKEDAPGAVSSEIKIPIYDVYFAMIDNNILDYRHFGAEDAKVHERDVYQRYSSYKENVYKTLLSEIREVRSPYEALTEEYKVYESNIITLLTKNGIIMSEKVDENDETYQKWTIEETISLGEYLNYCIAVNWIDTGKLNMEEKYATSSEIFDALCDEIIRLADRTSDFQKKIFKYMLMNDVLTGKDICYLLYDQDAIEIPVSEIEALEAGSLSAYQFMMNRIINIDVTPAQLALDPCNASVVITDVHNGQVLAMVSYPGYNNNKMANTVDAEYFSQLIADKSSPMLNYATQYKAAPGSTFKIVSASAGLMNNVIDPDTKIDCVSLFESIFPSPRCWSRYGHGDEVLVTAIRDSCNYFFYEVGFRLATANDGSYNDSLGLNKLYEYADLYGLTEKSGVEITEYSPDVSDRDAVRSAIGQGNNSYTTTQLARYAATIANSGTCYDLTLLDHTTDPAGNILTVREPQVHSTVNLPEEYWDIIHTGMRMVVENKSYFSDLAVDVAGKTGTAEQIKNRPNHALFICYAPADTPEIAMATRVPFGYSSDYAAQISRDIIKYYYGLADTDELITGTADTPDAGVTNEM
ncbi:MAG: penicillin-binding protein [Lachnospiraceae bacterium]|nr:penicillin-binding protein [Lachnospiraceae bacterium]